MSRVLANINLPNPEGHSMRTFGDYGSAGPIPAWNPGKERRSLAEILPFIPASEKPDVLIIASPEYLPIPRDVASFPGTRILLITDWNMCLRFLPDLCKLFDFCFVDRPGFRLLRRAGASNAHHQPLFGHDPAVFASRGIERNLEVSFCGNLNQGMHGQRNRLLSRLAKWGAGRPVHLGQAFGEAYLDVLNRSRLVFNYSIRGEANMRLFEAMACGAVPLVEADNLEVPFLFEADRHYFSYEPGRLEERLEALLADPGRIRAVADEARLAVADHTKAKRIQSLLDFAGRESRLRSALARSSAPDPVSSGKALAKMRVLGSAYSLPEALSELEALDPALPGLLSETFPASLLTLMEDNPGDPLAAANQMLERMLGEEGPPEPIRSLFQMRLLTARKRWPEALEWTDRSLRALDDLERDLERDPDRVPDLYAHFYPPIGLGKGVATDLNQAFREDLESVSREGYLGLMRAQCLSERARALLALDRPGEARECAARIPAGRFVSIDPHPLIAEACGRLGDEAGMRSELRAWIAEKPLDTTVWDKVSEGLEGMSDKAEWLGFLEEILTFARHFLPADQVERVRALLENRRG